VKGPAKDSYYLLLPISHIRSIAIKEAGSRVGGGKAYGRGGSGSSALQGGKLTARKKS